MEYPHLSSFKTKTKTQEVQDPKIAKEALVSKQIEIRLLRQILSA